MFELVLLWDHKNKQWKEIELPNLAEIQGHKMFLHPKRRIGNLDKDISVTRVSEPIETEFVKKNIKKGSIVIDLGAYIGYYTLLFAKLVGNKGKVFAFEPEPDNFRILKKNVEINGYQNIILENRAVSDTNEKKNLYISNGPSMHALFPSRFATEKYIQVKTIRLDDYFKNNNLKDEISFIKIDVEGSELGAIQGGSSLLDENKNLTILIEFHPAAIREFGYEPRDLLHWIVDKNFKLYFVNNQSKKIEQVEDFDSLSQKYEGDGVYTNLICVKGGSKFIEQ